MRVSFMIDLPGDGTLDEEAAQKRAAEGGPVTDEPYLFGALRLEADGQPTLLVGDDLQMLVPRLCDVAARSLQATGRAEAETASHYCRLTLIGDGETVRVLQDDGELQDAEVARYPQAALVAELRACGGRFAALVTALATHDASWRGASERLRTRFGAADGRSAGEA